MPRRRKKTREQDVTGRYLAGDFDDDAVDTGERFSSRSKNAQQDKMVKTAAMRAGGDPQDLASLPVGEVIQVHSQFSEVEHEQDIYLCEVRKTLSKVSDTSIVVGDRVRFRAGNTRDQMGRPEAVIEEILPRSTVLTRAASFKGLEQHPIVANAQQMLIVASILHPQVKWGLVDRMIIAAQSGGLRPIVCLNKIDLASDDTDAEAVLNHYAALHIITIKTSAEQEIGLDALRQLLASNTTVLAGHSGVGKSSLINAIQPTLDLRVGDVSDYTAKGRHTTVSARRYVLDVGGAVIDTPGVKVFGLWNITRENLDDFFPDVAGGNAPEWRVESFNRISESLAR